MNPWDCPLAADGGPRQPNLKSGREPSPAQRTAPTAPGSDRLGWMDPGPISPWTHARRRTPTRDQRVGSSSDGRPDLRSSADRAAMFHGKPRIRDRPSANRVRWPFASVLPRASPIRSPTSLPSPAPSSLDLPAPGGIPPQPFSGLWTSVDNFHRRENLGSRAIQAGQSPVRSPPQPCLQPEAPMLSTGQRCGLCVLGQQQAGGIGPRSYPSNVTEPYQGIAASDNASQSCSPGTHLR